MEDEKNKAIKDIIKIIHEPKMYINEKRYLTETINHLYKLGYYAKLDTIFDNGKLKKEA